MSELTLGQKRVHAGFNTDKNGVVDQIKNKAAELIDLIEAEKWPSSNPSADESEKRRVLCIAQTEIETGCMYALKGLFK